MLILIENQEDIKNIPARDGIIELEKIKKDIEINPFGKYLLEIEDNKIIAYLYYR